MAKLYHRNVAKLLAVLIFGFWFWLGKDNYFHWDEWGFFTNFNKGYWYTVLSWGSEHFIPLNVLHHFLLFKVFGLNYLPFQNSVTFFHTLNSYLLYKISMAKTNSQIISLCMMALYGFTSIFVENIVWSLGVSVILASTLFFCAYYFFLHKRFWPSFLALILSPLQHGITILAPLAFPRKIYWLVALANVVIILIVKQHNAVANFQFTTKYLLVDIPAFILAGVSVGTISREIFPTLYFYDSLSYPAHELRPILLPILFIGIVFIGLKLVKENWQLFCHYLPFIFITYVAIAPARAVGGLAAAVITRYPTPALFFVLLLTADLLKKYDVNKNLILAVTTLLVFAHVVANINFENNHWRPIVDRDRQFIEESKNLFKNNEIIDNNVSVKGIYPPLKLSDFWFLYPSNHKLAFKEGSGARLQSDYSQKAD